MKNMNQVVRALAITGLMALALTTGCVIQEPPSPSGVEVVGPYPDYCFWDGYEYVGWYGNAYYYWGPGRVWVVCDPVRVRRVNVWVHDNPNWRATATPLVRPGVETGGHPRPLREPPQRRRLDHFD